MKRALSIALVALVVSGMFALAFMRSAEFRNEDTTLLDDVASFLVLLLVLVFVAVAADFFGDSFLTVTKEKQRLKVIEPEHAAASRVIESARAEIADRQAAPQVWESRAKELGSAYAGEFNAEVARQEKRSSHERPFLGNDGRGSDES